MNSELQALVTGVVAGALMQATAQGAFLDADVELAHDGEGNYEPEIRVVVIQTGDRVLIKIEAEGE